MQGRFLSRFLIPTCVMKVAADAKQRAEAAEAAASKAVLGIRRSYFCARSFSVSATVPSFVCSLKIFSPLNLSLLFGRRR